MLIATGGALRAASRTDLLLARLAVLAPWVRRARLGVSASESVWMSTAESSPSHDSLYANQ